MIKAKADAVVASAKKSSAKKSIPLLTAGILGDHLASTFEIPKSHGKAFVDEVFEQMGVSLKKGGKVQIAHLGVFQVKKRAARKGRNPSTGESLKIKASKGCLHDGAGSQGSTLANRYVNHETASR